MSLNSKSNVFQLDKGLNITPLSTNYDNINNTFRLTGRSSANIQSLATSKNLRSDVFIQTASIAKSVQAGSSINIQYNYANKGNGIAGFGSTKFYLSKDTTLSKDDIYLGNDFNSNLANGYYRTESTNLTIGKNTAPGQYYIIFKADGNNNIVESNETNNNFTRAITVTSAPKADLIIFDVSAPKTTTPGSTIQFTYKYGNKGTATAGYSFTNFYLSKDSKLDSSDTYLGYDYNTSLANGYYQLENSSISLSKTLASGNYYILFKADTYDFVSESNENNNTFAFQITVNNKSSGNNGKYQTDIGYGLVNAAAAVAKGIGKNAFANINNLGGNNWGADLVKAPEVWAQGYTGKGITVAVIDTGVDTKHVDLSANIWKNTKEIAGNGIDDDGNGYIDDVNGWNFVNNNNNISDVQGHGTHVAGTIAAVKNNIGVTGIAYNAKIMPVKVLGDDGYGTYSGIAKGIRYAVNNGANVINLSLGGDSGNLELQQAIEYANSKGVFVVMASGNEGYSQPGYPAYYAKKWGIAVGSVNYNNDLSYFSNRAGVDPLAYVTAPGENIYSTTPGNSYGYKSGTSMATPHVAGVVALMLSANPNLTPAQVRSILTSTATA